MTQSAPYRPDVQALRGVAVVLVVAFHAWPGALPGGYIGVDVFFVISGYLITGLLLRDIEGSGRVDFAAFYARRIRRLVPAAMVVIAGTAVVAALYRSPLETGDLVTSAIAAALYVSNLWFSLLSVDYLQDGLHKNPLLHTWSLGVEEQFYLLWPALMVGSTLLLQRLPARRAIAWMVGCVSILSLGAGLWLTAVLPSWAFFSLPSRAWELGLGATAMLLHGRTSAMGVTMRRAMVVAGMLCILAAAFAFSSRTRFPGHAALLPALGAFLVIAGGASLAGERNFGLHRFAPMERLGDLSYSWYLWHWPVLILFAEAWPATSRNLVGLAGVTASLALAALTLRFIEDPVRYHKRLQASPGRTFALGMALTVGAVGVIVASRYLAATEQGDLRQKMVQAARDRPRLYDDKCFASALDTVPPACTYGVAGARRTAALIGDSHAAQWFPALEQLARTKGFRLEVFVKAACPLAEIEPYHHKLSRTYVECTQWRERVFERLAALRPVLVIGGNASQYEPFVARDRQAQARWRTGLDASLQRLETLASQVVVLADTPRPGFHAPACLARRQAQKPGAAPACHFQLADSVEREALLVEQAATRGRAGVMVIDMNDTICTSPSCPVVRGGTVLFHDSQHLSATFARSLAEVLWRRLPPTARAGLED